jgi:hypothetical protein
VHPQQLAGGCVERHDGAARARGRVQPSLDHERRRLKVEFRSRTEAVRLEPPGDFEVVEVVAAYLIERGVACVAEIPAVGPPLAVLRAALSIDRRSSDQERTDGHADADSEM